MSHLHTTSNTSIYLTFHKDHSKRLFEYIRSQIRYFNEANAADIASQVWLEAWELVVEGRFSFLSKSWLYTRASQRIIDERRKSRTVSLDTDIHHPTYSMAMDDRLDFRTLLNTLPQDEAMASWLFFQDGLTVREIADVLNVPKSGVQRLLASGAGRMRDVFRVA